jgi:hypothetical protein
MTAYVPKPTDYTDRDLAALRSRLQQLVQSVFPQWTDYTQSNFGQILLEMFSYVGDVLGYYQDAQAREAFLSSATQRRSLLRLAQLIGYAPAGPSAATVEMELTLGAVPAGNVVFPVGTTVQTNDTDPITFQLLTPATILANANPPRVAAVFEHSVSRVESAPSTGKAHQEVLLAYSPFLQSTLVVTAANGAYTVVANLLGSGPTDRHCYVKVDHNERATVVFGNNTNVQIPSGSITLTYRTGGGALGNSAGSGDITNINGTFQDTLSNPVTVTVTNPLGAVGGADRPSNAQIRQLAPESLRVLTRTVSREDFEINARRLSGVARALMLTADEDSSIPENEGWLYIVPVGGGQPTTGVNGLREQVLEMVTETYPTMATFDVQISGTGATVAPDGPGLTSYISINVQATVTLRAGVVASTVKQRILDNLAAYFAIQNDDGSDNTNVNFGYYIQDTDGSVVSEISRSDIFNVVRDTDGVREVGLNDFLLNSSAQDVALQRKEFPILGTITLYNSATGAVL